MAEENTTYITTNKTSSGDPQLDTFVRLSFDATTIVAANYVELDMGATPRYVCVENYTDLSKFEWFEGVTVDVSAGSFVASTVYTIKTVGTTDYTLIGAPSNTVGVSFTATGVGAGTGVAVTNDNVCIKTVAAGTRTLVSANSILVRERTVQLSQNATTAMILASKNLSIRVLG
jgi:hypothetical protein